MLYIDADNDAVYWTGPRWRGNVMILDRCRSETPIAIGDDRLGFFSGSMVTTTAIAAWLTEDGGKPSAFPQEVCQSSDDGYSFLILDRRPGRRVGFWSVLPHGYLEHVMVGEAFGYGATEVMALAANGVAMRQALGWACDNVAYVDPPVLRFDMRPWLEGGPIPVPEMFIDFVPILERQSV